MKRLLLTRLPFHLTMAFSAFWSLSQAASPAASASSPMAQPAMAEPISLMRPSASSEINAEPSKVWKKLVSAEGMAAFGIAADKKKALEKVGDHVHATLMGDAGNTVVTHADAGKEWRAAWEPDKGHYICAIRFQLQPQGKGTLLTYSDWYSDEKPESADATLKQTQKEMNEGLARFKALVEKASAGP